MRELNECYPLGTPSSALFGKPRSDGTQAFLLRGGTEKGTAVPLPARRPQSAIPFTAALKPLELCDSIYAKPVQSAAITPQPRRKRKPIPFLYASYLRSRAVRPVREVAPKGKGEIHKRGGNRRCLSLLCARRASGPFPPSADGEIPARQRRIANATRLHHKTAAENWAAAHSRRIAYATRVHRKTAAAELAFTYSYIQYRIHHHQTQPSKPDKVFVK